MAVQQQELDWFRSYNSGCSNEFMISNDSSSPVTLMCSLQQSLVCPKEFAIYMKDIVEIINKFADNHHLYADDLQLFEW